MKDKKDISRAEADYLESKYTCERNKGRKTFADFVDKVIEQIPAKKINKKFSFCEPNESNDPLMVLRSRGLVDIESSSIETASSASEVDLTLYTEESRIGNVVKVFSSTHRFKNGRLVYSTTQEACPQLDEEIKRFNHWWKSQGPGKLKKKEPSFQNKYTRKKLCDIFRDIQKQEIIKRYERARRKDPISCKSLPSMETARFKKQLTFKAKSPLISEEVVISRKIKDQAACLPRCEKKVSRNFSSDCSTESKAENLQSESEGGKVTFRASWLHRSPRKSQRSTSGNLVENRELNRMHFGCNSSQKTIQNKATPVLKGSKLQSSVSVTRILPSRPRSMPNRNLSSSSDRGMRLKSPLNNRNSKQTDSNQSFKHCADYKNSRYPFACEQDEPSYSPCKHFNLYDMHRTREPLHANADFDDNVNNSSDNNTSVCTIFYEANGDWINEGQESCIYKSHQDEGKYHSKNHIKTVEGLPYTSSPKFSRKCLSGNSRKIHAKDDLDNSIKCFAKCHTKHQDEHEVSIMTGIVSHYNNDKYEDDKYEAMKAIENFVNEEALEKFSKRCGDSIDKLNCKVLNTAARKQFYKEIIDCCQQARNNKNRKRK
ncbi:hypothetical protein HNY73_023129 [Argiope bruennichi]|uniref:Uncharacterized protein n=1 Tax=Argiope bruennichi TaxID=94029 RepID=A0A8T0E4G1_ARGBR|nr:hypothetical protein HNY73_023129 [Argiope bruennichi]